MKKPQINNSWKVPKFGKSPKQNKPKEINSENEYIKLNE